MPQVSNPNFNYYIKEVARLAGIDEMINNVNYWNPGIECTAYLQLNNLIYINHGSFAEDDLAAFNFELFSSGIWSVKGSKLFANGMPSLETARFGEADWNYYTLETELSNLEGEAGFMIARNSSPVTHIYVLVSNNITELTLKVYDSYPGGVLAQHQYPLKDKVHLRILAYDDLLAIGVNGESITVKRDGAGSGFCAFAVNGEAAFENLYAEPLPMYAFNFSVSRFNSFKSHIEDFESGIYRSQISFENDFEAARVALQPLVQNVMSKKSTDTEREALFVKFAASGGIFLGENVMKSRIPSLVTASNNAYALLLESLESLDMANGSLELNLSKKFIGEEIHPLTGLAGLTDILATAKFSAGGNVFHGDFLNEVMLRNIMETEGLGRLDTDTDVITKWHFNPLINDVQVAPGVRKNELSLMISYASLLPPVLSGKPMLFLQYNKDVRELKIYDCIPSGRRKIKVVLKETVTLNLRESWDSSTVTKEIQLLIIPAEKTVIFGERSCIVTEWRNSAIAVIQNHNATKLLLLPEDAVGLFGPGSWKLSFELNRSRYETTDTADTLSKYTGEKDIYFDIVS
jgi:hypothetical protein